MKEIFCNYISKNGILLQHKRTTFDGQTEFSPPEIHVALEIGFTLSGSALSYQEGTPIFREAGSLLITPPNVVHWEYAISQEPYERIVLQVNPSLLPKLKDMDLSAFYKMQSVFSRAIHKELIDTSNVKQLLLAMTRCCIKNDTSCILDLLDLLYAFIETIGELVKQNPTYTLPDTKKTLADKCLSYVHEHAWENLTAAKIADALSVNAKYLQEAFKKKFDVPLHRYISLQKIALARTMLHQGIAAQDVARKLGFENYVTFHRLFRRLGPGAPRTFAKM